MRRPAAALVALLLTPFTACGPFGDDGAEKAARALATALEQYDVSKVAFTEKAAQEQLDTLLEPLAGHPSEIEVGEVAVDGDTATARLTWQTDLGPGTWERATPVALRKVGEDWRVLGDPAMVESTLKPGEEILVSTLKAKRGRVLGAGGAPIVEERPVLRIGLDKTQIPDGRLAQSARELARVLDLDAPRLVKAVRAAGPRAFVEALVVRRDGLPSDYALQWNGIAGAVGLSDHRPLAPTREFARQLLGVVGPVTAEVLKESEGRLAAGDDAGLSGLQRRYDEQLGGRSGRLVSATSPDGERRELFQIAPSPGQDLSLTLDVRLQQRADRLQQQTGSDSALVAIRPSTGELLAAASGPASNGYDTATFGRYPPGSTFKIVSSLALLRSGLTPSSEVRCPATTTVDGKRFSNYSDYPSGKLGRITLTEAVANSCNTAFITARDRIEGSALADAAAALGLGVDHDLGFPAYFGQVPAPASETEAAADLIGQGKVTASPMVMATVLASVLEGKTVVPRLVAGHTATASPGKPLTAAEADALRAMLRQVVAEGSGRGLQGVAELAKTGTAEFGDGSKTHAWMVAGRRDLAVAVFVAEGESGSQTAGPILREFLEG